MPKRTPASRSKRRKSASPVVPVEPSLGDLTREKLTQSELKLAYDEIDNQTSHRAAAILAAAFVEDAIRFALKAEFQALTDAECNQIFGTSFSRVIDLGHAVGLYGKEAKSDLHVIRIVRNVFAHAMKPIDFDTPQIAKEVAKLTYIDLKRGRMAVIRVAPMDNVHRKRYADHCRVLIYEILGLARNRRAAIVR
jgi:hypothetical protein